MQWVKQIKHSKYACIGLFVILFFVTRLPGLATDVINPDGVNWHYRSEQFIVGLKTRDFAKTFQHYHPGVTLMWIMGSAIEVLRQVFPIERIYTHYNFLTFHFADKYALITTQLILSVIILYLLSQAWGFKKSFLAMLLFTLEPFFVGNSRLLHLDVLTTLFLFGGLVAGYLAMQKNNYVFDLLAGAFMAFAFLTKSIAIGGVLFMLGWYVIHKFSGSSTWKRVFAHLGAVFSAFLVTTFVLFPALWVKPLYVLTEIFSESERIGVRDGHGQIIFGVYTRNGGILFYPLVLLVKLSPVTLLGVLVTAVFGIKRLIGVYRSKPLQRLVSYVKNGSLLVYLTVFYLGYFVAMVFPSKKIDRYMVPMFPYFAILAVWGYCKVKDKVSKYVLYALVVGFIVWPLVRLYPFYFTYTSPVVGSASIAHKVIAQKPFGVGIPALKDLLFKRYGLYPRLGFYDIKPMGAIYPNSKICDIRVCGTSDYDILILGPNEEIPEKVLKSEPPFFYDTSMYINGLEYWKIYVKETKLL